MPDDSTDAIIKSILAVADRDRWSAADRAQAFALLAADKPAGKPAWKSASFWLLGATALLAGTVAVTGMMTGSKTAAAVGTAAATALAATQVVTNSRDKRAAGDSAARKLEAAFAGTAPPPPPLPGATIPDTACDTCHGTGLVYVPDEHGKQQGTKACPRCQP